MLSVAARQTFLSKRIPKEPSSTVLYYAKSIHTTDNDYEYLQRSKIPTMHFQPSLPRLPIPKLEDTCKRYLNAQKPILENDQMQKTDSIVSRFLKGEGAQLHSELLKIDALNKHTSYISEPWFDMYLRDRRPLPINYNPFLIFIPEINEQYNRQLVKTTNLIISSIRFLKSLRANLLEPEVFHLNPKKSNTKLFRTFTSFLPSSISWYGAYLMNAYPLDMSQYSNLFNSTRIPQLEKDEIVMDKSAKHIVVMRKGHFYAFNVLNEQGNIISPHEIATNLLHILKDKRSECDTPVGTLTAAERNCWAKARAHLVEIGNGQIFKKIDSAAFIVILEDEPVGNDEINLQRCFFHGKAENRWFDKSFSLITTKDGFAGLNFEHSWGDGVAVLRYFQDIKKDISEKPHFHPEDEEKLSGETLLVERLDFQVDDKIKDIIAKERVKYDKWTKDLDISFMIYEGFGKKECKSFGVSPDAVMQLAFQLALFKQESKSVAAYESCSTAAFKYGRTETIRPCTIQTKNLCSMMINKSSNVSIEQLKKMIIDCSNAHTILTKEAAMGQGFDRHLYALRILAEKSGLKPEIFSDISYEILNHNILSTSTLSSPVVLAGGFGPVVNDGFGIGYMMQDKRLGAVVTSYSNHRNANDYVNSLKASVTDLHKIFLKK